MYAYNVRSITD